MIDKKKLSELLEKAKERDRELASLDVIEAEARQALAEVIEVGNIGSESAQRKTGEARMRLDMVKSRRKLLNSQRGETTKLFALLENQGELHNADVTAAVARLREKFLKGLLPVFGGDATECQLFFERLEMRRELPPPFQDLRRYYYVPPVNRNEDRDVCAEVKTFLSTVEREQKILSQV